MCRRLGLDLATFGTELGILALRGFADMKEKARDLMIHNKIIVAQQSCDLRRHLDGAAAEASIGDIVDSCRMWKVTVFLLRSAWNRCSRLDTTFPYVLPGWTVDVRNGQYRTSQMCGNGQDLRRGKKG